MSNTSHLFVFYVGGMIKGCHVELHDMRFAIGASAEDCWDDLRAQWWGEPKSLHLDAWGPLLHADGHDVTVSDQPAVNDDRLWFVNLGGYDPAQFTELHRNVFVVASDAQAAKKKAMEEIRGWASPHKDNVLDIDAVVDVAATLFNGEQHLHLSPGPPKPFRFKTQYVPIGRMADKASRG
ncbi:DUF1543 domain-containing protein [Parvularcula sp. LCG005]|uniref:DUF1543 domain-containing protein n=1 Tax=Parvularcula sp. LCG005 TaxID=3078805 RepID=UPI0029421BA3|nr:DUF1543 domain-containing protein [Parvularcula sp. LCG005]WOI52305.1 DUF1543 domain-containing protein [Parvularcula sp. LCG005]